MKEGQELYEAYFQTLFNIHKGNIVEERKIELDYQAYKEDLRQRNIEKEEEQQQAEQAILEDALQKKQKIAIERKSLDYNG